MPIQSLPFVPRKNRRKKPLLDLGFPEPDFEKDTTSRDERKNLRDMTYETVGGIAGGAIGSALGPLGSIAGSGLGSAAGRGMSMVEDQIEYGERPGQTAQDKMKEVGESALWGAMGESVGRILPVAVRGTANLAKKAFSQTPEAKVLSQLADKYGIPLNLAERSGKTWLRLAEVGLDRLPFATNTIRKARRAQYKAWTDAVNGVLDEVHKGNVTPDEFAVKAEAAFADLRSAFNQTVDEKVAKTAATIRANPATKTEAGRALQNARQQNLDELRAWAKKEYGQIERQFGDVKVPVLSLSEGLQEISPAAESMFSPKARQAIATARNLAAKENPKYTAALQETADAVGLGSIEELQQQVPALYQKEVERLLAAGINPTEGSGTLPYAQAAELRTQILGSISRLSAQPNSADVRALYGLLDNLNTATEAGFEAAAKTATGDAQAVLLDASKRIKQTNATYRGEMRRLNPPRGAKDEGNIAAGVLNDTRINPDTIQDQIVNSPTMIEGAARATSPEAMSALERSKFDELVRGATVENPADATQRVSPSSFRANIRKYLPMTKLFGVKAPDVAGIGASDLAGRELSLYKGQLPKAVDAGGGEAIISTAFPPRSPKRVERSLGLFEEAGIKPEAQRAYLDRVLEGSHKGDPTLGSDKYISAEKFGEAMQKTGNTFSDVVGTDVAGKLEDLSEVGKTMRSAEKEFGNPSGTARAQQVLEAATTIGTGLIRPDLLPAVIGGGAMANMTARAFTNPAIVKGLTSGTRPLLPMLRRGPTSAAGRMIGQTSTQALRPRESFFGVSMPQDVPDAELDKDLIPIEDLDKDLIPLN